MAVTRSRGRSAALALLLVIIASWRWSASGTPASPRRTCSPDRPTRSTGPLRPNVVLIVADDLDKKLMRWMPRHRRLIADQGATFDRYYVEQSTCCTSRSTILSGQYTHNHGVRGNHYPAGGFLRFHDGQESVALPTWLEANGYRSAMLGKYLNEYPFPGGYNGTAAEKDAMKRVRAARVAGLGQPGRRRAVPPARHHLERSTASSTPSRGRSSSTSSWPIGCSTWSTAGTGWICARAASSSTTRPTHRTPPTPRPHAYDDDFTDVHYPRTPNFDEADVSDKYGLAAFAVR